MEEKTVSRRQFVGASAAFALASTFPSRAQSLGFQLFDTHLHFFTNDVAQYPLSGIPEARPRLLANPNTVEKVLAFMDQSGVEGCAGVQYRTAYGEDDSYLLDVAARHRGRIRPVVILDAKRADASQKLEVLVKTRGAAGLRLTGPEEKDGSDPWLNSPNALELWKTADTLHTPVALMYQPLVMENGSEESLQRISEIAGAYPHLTIVTDHIGWPVLKNPHFGLIGAHATLRSHPNVHYKLTTMNLNLLEKASILPDDFIRALVDFYGPERVMWGSDFGNSEGTYAELVKRGVSATAKLNAREKRAVLHDTGRTLYGRA